MVKYLYLLLLGFAFQTAHAQQADTDYAELTAKAGLLHLQKDYTNAIKNYEAAFKLKTPDALTAYKAAGAYALAGNNEEALKFLNKSIDAGWSEADWLATDPYFSSLASALPTAWEQIKKKAYSYELDYAKNLRYPELRKEINQMMLKDQQLRYKRVQAIDKEEIQKINNDIHQADAENLDKAKKILQQYGWPKISDIGKDGANNFWLVVQHADNDVRFQRTALQAMEKWKGTAEINNESYAFLYDRVQCNLNYKQLYGTQVTWTENGEASGFRPIAREDQADQRRKKLGMISMRIYALGYGFNYVPISKEEALKKDRDDLTTAKKLTDSTQWYYKQKQFQKAYDAANNASMIAGGMTSKQSFDAAILFAKIAAVDTNSQYKSIALDFLQLLALQQELPKAWQDNSSLALLKSEPRWAEIEKMAKQ